MPCPSLSGKAPTDAPVKEEQVEITEESPEDLLRRLIEEDEEHTENVRYILAIMLERKKQLVEVDSQPTATGIIRIYEHRKSGDVFIVKDPNIPLSEVEKVQDEVAILLENGGRIPEPISEPEPVSEDEPAGDSEPDPSPSATENEAPAESLVNSSSEEE